MAGTRNPWEENYGANDGQDTGAKPWEQAYQQPEAPKSRTLGAVANDTVIEVANAAAGGVSAAANFVKPGNAVSGWIDKNIVKAGEDSQSDVTKAAKQQFRDEVENADGVMGELGAVGKYVVQNPLLSAAQAAGSFVGPGLAVRAAGFAGKAAQLGAKGVERAGRAGGVAAGAAMAGGDAAGTAYELSTKAGATEDQAVAAGRQASVIPAVIGGVGGMFGAEKLLAGAKGFAGGATSRALKTGASEAVQEGIEEGATQYEGQRAAMPYDPSIDPSKGVAAAAGMGAALGGITGAGASLLTGRDTGQQPNPGTQTPPGQTQPAPAAGPTLALPAPDRGVIQVAGDGTARTPAYQAPGYVGDVTDVEPRAVNPVREQVAAAAEQGGVLSSAALTAIDTGLSDAMQPAPEQVPPQISLEEADARDRAAYEQFFAGFDTDPVVSRYFENDDDIPDFDAASNASEEDFLRALGATDEDIQDAIATSSQSAIPQSSVASNAGPQAYEPAGPREGAGEGAASQTGQVNAGAIQQAAPDAPVPGVGGTVGTDGAGSAAAAVSGASGPGGSGTGATTGSGAGATEVGSARTGGRGDSNQALSTPTNLRDALVRVRQQKQEAANAQAAQAPAPAAAPVPGPAAAPAVEAAGPALNIKAITAKQIPDMTDAELQAAIEHYGPAHKRTAKLQKEAQRRAAPSAITPTTTQGNADGPQASQAQQASPQPTQAAAAPAAAAGLTDGAPAENTGAQAAPAPGPQAATAAEPEFTTIKTVYGDSVTVRTADLNSDKPRLRQYTKDGKSKAVPAIHRDNLDLTGDKRASIAKEDADNPFFNVITTKDGSTFASQAAASRELNHRAMGETHEVVAASEVQDGAQGFVIRRKRADAIGTSVNTAQGAINTEAPQATAPVGDEQQFAPETGTLGIPRAEMPQIPSQSHGGLVKHLNAQGIAHETTMVEAAELKPTQAEYSPAKVEAAKTAAGDRAVIVSSDGHIIDGHHQALAAAEEGKPVKAIVLDAPVEQALEAVKASPSAQPATLADAAPAQSPQDFVPAPDGGLDYGEITPEMGRAMRRQAGKIRLRRGDETQGLVHIAERHLDQFKKRGFESVPDFVASVAKSFTAIYKRDGAALDVVLEDGSRGRLVVQLEMAADGDFYDVKTASPIREDQFKNREPLWERAGTSTPTAGESSPPFPWGQNGDDSVPPNAPAAQPEAPKLTPAEAKSLMAWEDLGQKGGVKTHALTFYESQADKDAKRGRMIVAKVSKEVDSGNWTVEGTGEKLAVLGMAKKKAEQVGMEKAVADGFVEAAAAAPADATPEPAKPIEDAGEKIGGARKDRWKERGLNLDDLDAMTEAEGAELATKANVWKPDYEALAAQSEPVSAAMTKVIYDRLAAKPKKNTPEGRRQYVQMMRIVRDVLTEAKGPDAVRNAYLEIRKRAGLNAADPAAKSAGREMLFSVYKGRSDPFVLDGGDLMKVKKMVTDGFPAKGDPWKTRLTVGRAEGGAGTTERGIEIYMERSAEVGTPLTREQILDGFYRVSTKDNKTVAFAASKADAEAAAATVYERDMKGKKDGKPEPVRPNLDELKRENLPQRIDRDVTSEDFVRDLGFRGVEFGNWSAQDERQRILNMAYDGLMDLAEIMGVPPKAMSLNGTLGMAFGARGGGRFAAHYEPGKLVINMTKIRGGGSMAHEWAHAMDHYFGELDKPDAYTTQARGASGWYSEDQYNGVPRRRMERVGNEWKNVEKMRLDNLRPEMAAAFDEVMRALFQKQITKAEMVRSQELDLERTEALARSEQDAEMKAMYQNMVQNKREALNELRNDPEGKLYAGRGRSDYAQQAQALSGKSVDGYWVRPTEMFARAFESWVFDKVTAMGARSDYLVHGVEEDRFAGGGYKGNPYPTGEERARINAAFDKLAATIKTKETEKGVAMFSSADSTLPAKPLSLDRVNQLVQEALSGIRGAPPVEVTARPADVGLQVPAGSVGYGVTLRSGDIYVFQSAMGSDLDVFKTVFHELFHRGVRVLVPKGQYVQTMLDLAKGDSRIQQLAIEWKNTEMGQKQKENLREQGYTGAELTGQYEALAIEEALAAVAEEIKAEGRLGSKPKNMTIRFLANWLAKLADLAGMKKLAQGIRNMSYNEAERFVMRAIDRSGEPVQAGRTDNLSAKQAAQAGDQTQTENFRRWFGDSKVVDAEGKPLVVYHGTGRDIAEFDTGNDDRLQVNGNRTGAWGAYFSPSAKEASIYAEMSGGDQAVMPVYLSLQNPYAMSRAEWGKHSRTSAKMETRQEGRGYAKQVKDDLIAGGYDGIVIRDRGFNDEWVAFRPEQIKSAIGNNGNFDPANADIRFRSADLASRAGMADLADLASKAVGDAIKSVTVTNIKQRAGFKLTDYLGIGLQALGRRQIVDIYGDMLPLGEYNRLVQQMEADKNEGSAEADQLVKRWAKLQDESKLADLMHDATLAQIDPAEDFVEGDDKARYMMLQGRFNALTDAAKQVYTDTRDSYQAHHAKVRSAIKERIERSEIKGERKAALLKQMDDEFFKAIKGVYFPLARFGQYAVTVKGPDGKVESVSRAETKAEAEALRNNLLSAFPRDKGFTVGRVMLSKDFIADRDAVGRGFMTELYQVLDKQDMDAAQRAELEDTLGQLYLSSLPDLSWAKHGIHRKGTPGFSQDARRAFAQNMFHGARYLAKLRYSDLMQDELAAMQRHVDDWREVEDFDQNSAQRVVDEMNKRHESLMNPQSNPLSTALTSLGFVFHLGLSPASAMVNLSQTALVAYPIMGAKWGFGKASAALLKASAEAAKGKNDITASLNADELAAYNEAVRAGTIDVTMAHDLAGIAQGEDAGVMWKIRPVMRWASFLFHHAERFNRQVTFVAAYRLAREAGADAKSAYEQATKATYDGHYDYSAANRPRIMQGNVAKVLLLFKQYGQNMVYTLARNAQQSIKGESPEVRAQARKALGGLLAMHAAAAGVLGLPMVTTLLAAASMIGGDDDEPWDAKVALQNMLADTFGQKPAEVLAHGLSRLTPWDISGRVGLDKLIFPDVQEGLEGQRLWESAATQALGPVGGIFGGALKGLDLISDGHYKLGLEAMLPAVLRQGVKSIRYATEGAQDKGGVVIKDEVSLAGVAGQLLGFSPSEVRLAQEGKSAIYQHDKALTGRREELLSKAARATRLKDAEARAEAMKEIERFNQKNPKLRITPLNVLQSVRNSQKRIDQAEGGVYLPKNRRDAIQAGRFALAESE